MKYKISGAKHFGSGSGVMDYMVTTAVVEGESRPDWFFVQTRDQPWDGSAGIKQVSQWDAHGMSATQSHAFQFEGFPATRIAWTDHLNEVAKAAGPLIGCWFTAVIVGIVDVAMQTAKEKLASKSLSAYEKTEWIHANKEYWLIEQAFNGMHQALQNQK